MEIEHKEQQPWKPPVFLRVVAILSLISIVSGLLSSVLGLFSGPLSAEEIDTMIEANMSSVNQLNAMGETGWADTALRILNLVRYTNANFYMDRLINAGTYATGLAGVIFMLRGRKAGFHLYIVYSLLALVSIYASAPVYAVPTFYFMVFGVISLIFIMLYSLNLKYLR